MEELRKTLEEVKTELAEHIEKEVEKQMAKRVAPIDVRVKEPNVKDWAVSALILAKSIREKWDIDRTCEFYGVSKEKALSGTSIASGGAFIPENLATEMIGMLQDQSVYFQAKPNIRPLPNGNTTYPVQTAGSSLYWLNETENITASEPTFSQITMTAKKGGIIVAISNDLLKNANINIAQVVQQDILTQSALAIDNALIVTGTGTSATPKSLVNFATAGNTFAQTGGASFTTTNINTDIFKAKKLLAKAKVQFIRPAWFMTPATKIELESRLDGNSNTMVWARELRETGTLAGIPVYMTTFLDGGSTSTVLLVDMNEVYFGQQGGIEITFQENVAYYNGSTVVSGFSSDQSAFRLIVHLDQQVAHPEAIVKITNVYWGA